LTTASLSDSVQEIKDAISDFRRSSVLEEALSALERIVDLFDIEPLAEFLTSVLPNADFDKWWTDSEELAKSQNGHAALQWPKNREERVSIQVQLCQVIIRRENNVLKYFAGTYCDQEKPKLLESAYFEAFANKVLDLLVRDIGRLIKLRLISPILLEAMRNLPVSGDETLDELLQEACRKFKDPAPRSLQGAIEKLWDSWERIKTVELPGNKRNSIKMLLEQASNDISFREYLDQEAKALTEIGNKFHIRHFETDKLPLNQPEKEYLFHRLYSLIHFLLLARTRSESSSAISESIR
jgi:hypothetical protein